MSVGSRIRELRNAKQLTQKDLADKLYITPQALSKWEADENEPSLDMISKMASIFEVSTDYMLGREEAKEEKPENKSNSEDKTPAVVPEPKPVLAVCEQCNRPIYVGSEIVRQTIHHRGGGRTKVICIQCNSKNIKAEREAKIAHANIKRKRNYIWGSIITTIIMGLTLAITIGCKLNPGIIVGSTLGCLLFYPFIGCLFLDNNIVLEVVAGVAEFGFVKFPGVIFSLDFDGIKFLIFCKILFWVLGFLIAALFIGLAILLGLIISPFVYPFALTKSYKHPEEE